jgi:hypothetical protein
MTTLIEQVRDVMQAAYDEYDSEWLDGWTWDTSLENYTATELPGGYSEDMDCVYYRDDTELWVMSGDSHAEDRSGYYKVKAVEFLRSVQYAGDFAEIINSAIALGWRNS